MVGSLITLAEDKKKLVCPCWTKAASRDGDVTAVLGDMARILILVQLVSWYSFNIVNIVFYLQILLQHRTGFCARHKGQSILE